MEWTSRGRFDALLSIQKTKLGKCGEEELCCEGIGRVGLVSHLTLNLNPFLNIR